MFSRIFTLVEANRKISVNPARFVKLRRENNARVRWLEPEEEAAVRDAIKKLSAEREPELDLALHTGMRWSEQYRLLRENVNLKLGLITIARAKHGERRRIQLNAEAQRAIERMLARNSPFICGETTYDTHHNWWEGILKEAKVHDFRWHDLRHTFASRLVMAGVDLRTVQELMGHKTIQMTMRYSHLAASHLREAVNRLVPVAQATATESATGVPAQVQTKPRIRAQVQ